jgi:hypothetical protein
LEHRMNQLSLIRLSNRGSKIITACETCTK